SVHDGILRQALDDTVLVEHVLAAGGGELVREVVVALLERLHVGRALDAPAPVDVEVREDAKEPGAHVRTRTEGAPAPKRPRIRHLHQIFCLLTGPDQPSRNSVDLVGEPECLLLEPDAIACFGGDASRFGGRLGVAHRATVPTRYRRLQRAPFRRYSPV